jgi:hypothetical protein
MVAKKKAPRVPGRLELSKSDKEACIMHEEAGKVKEVDINLAYVAYV